MDIRNETSLTVRGKTRAIYNKTSQVTAIQQAEAGTADHVAHVTSGDGKINDNKNQGLSYDQ